MTLHSLTSRQYARLLQALHIANRDAHAVAVRDGVTFEIAFDRCMKRALQWTDAEAMPPIDPSLAGSFAWQWVQLKNYAERIDTLLPPETHDT